MRRLSFRTSDALILKVELEVRLRETASVAEWERLAVHVGAVRPHLLDLRRCQVAAIEIRVAEIVRMLDGVREQSAHRFGLGPVRRRDGGAQDDRAFHVDDDMPLVPVDSARLALAT